MTGPQDNFSFFHLLTMLGGLSVFLFGLEMMSNNLRKSAGASLKLIIEKATGHPLLGVGVGALVTGIIQSSSATTSILVSLVQSQIMAFENTVAVIMGANIGTTVTAQIVAFKITSWALPIIFVGFLIQTLAKRTRVKNFGYVILGLGMLFFGLAIMSDAMKILRSSPFFLDLMQDLENVWLGVLVGALFTALVQSSSASIGIMIGLASQGLISIEAAIPVIFGANIGTCVTAVLAALKSSYQAKRVAAAHILFNVGGVLLFVFWIPQFTDFIKSFSPEGDIIRVIANAQTAFNLIATIAWLPFIGALIWMAERVVPQDKKERDKKYNLPRVSGFSLTPEIALIQSKDAIRSLKNIVKEMLLGLRAYLIDQCPLQIEKILDCRNDQKALRHDLIDFLSRLSKLRMSYAQSSDIINQTCVINEIESVANNLELSIVKLEAGIPHFEAYATELETYFRKTIKYFSKSCNAFLQDDVNYSYKILNKIAGLKNFENEFRSKCITKIHKVENSDTETISIDEVNLESLEILRAINLSSSRICNLTIEEASRLAELNA